ncbi:aromatic acid exporter family protein [Peribacillus sp. SCS-37]|uniref:aromatic acid exporter family protein n=1 Tax=Paraperibacillus esterisolvens TaxID=3115296 RepID=UPI003906AF50
MFIIGSRTIKTAIGAMVSLMIAGMFSLENAATAAIITLLSVQSTKRQSAVIALRRFAAGILGMALAVILFQWGSFTPISVGVLLLIYIPLMAKLGLHEGIIPGFVIVMQLYLTKNITYAFVLNEVFIITIGILVALLFNLYMPSVEKDLRRKSSETEENFKLIFLQLARFIRKKERVWNDESVLKSENAIREGKDLARRSVENSFFRKENYYRDYFNMRGQQFDIIQRVIPIILHLPTAFEQNVMAAELMEEIGHSIHKENPATALLVSLRALRQTFEKMELPKTREEFETRAALLVFINEIERFLQIKSQFILETGDSAAE